MQVSHRTVTRARGSLHTSRWLLSVERSFCYGGRLCRASSNVFILAYHVHWRAAAFSLALKINHFFFLGHQCPIGTSLTAVQEPPHANASLLRVYNSTL